jgi:hypothetical protein
MRTGKSYTVTWFTVVAQEMHGVIVEQFLAWCWSKRRQESTNKVNRVVFAFQNTCKHAILYTAMSQYCLKRGLLATKHSCALRCVSARNLCNTEWIVCIIIRPSCWVECYCVTWWTAVDPIFSHFLWSFRKNVRKRNKRFSLQEHTDVYSGGAISSRLGDTLANTADWPPAPLGTSKAQSLQECENSS